MRAGAVEERLGAVEAHVRARPALDRHREPQLLGPGLRRVGRLHPDDAVVLPEVVEGRAEPTRVEQLVTVRGTIVVGAVGKSSLPSFVALAGGSH